MQIVLFRHGIAEDRNEFANTGLPDSERPLTRKGVQRTRAAARGLATVLPGLTAVGTSPYLRARQTAELLAGACESGGASATTIVDDLQPGSRASGVCRWLEQGSPSDVVALVGHEPDLSELMAWFTTGREAGFARFKKAGACLIDFSSMPARGAGELQWLVTPGVLRRLGD